LSFTLAFLVLFCLGGCKPASTVCPQVTGTPRRLGVPPEALPTPTLSKVSAPIMMEIGGKTIPVNKVVQGPLCNDAWSGNIYVSCNVQVYSWVEQPLFLEDCDLKIEPGTVIYVAYHNEAAYYNGCSCHTNELAGP